jgi:hypothetical protein
MKIEFKDGTMLSSLREHIQVDIVISDVKENV